MTKIPDDVVERALKIKRDSFFARNKLLHDPEAPSIWSDDDLSDMRAAGEVFVAWEREQNIEIARRHRSMVEINEPLWHEGQDWACQRIEDAIHARGALEKDNAHE